MFRYVLSLLLVGLLAVSSLCQLGDASRTALVGHAHAAAVHRTTPSVGSSAVAGLASFTRGLKSVAKDAADVLRSSGPPAADALYEAGTSYTELTRSKMRLLGGQRAVLLQLADPRVAAGVASYSSFKTDAMGRLQRTMQAMNVIQFGSAEDSQKMLKRLVRIHERVNGTLEDGTRYDAMDPDAQYWVLATLVDSILAVERRYFGQYDEAARAAYFEQSKPLARAFGIGEEHIPADYAAFKTYMRERLARLEPIDAAREVARDVMSPNVDGVPSPALAPLEWVTRDLMPKKLARQFQMKKLSLAERLVVDNAARVSRLANR